MADSTFAVPSTITPLPSSVTPSAAFSTLTSTQPQLQGSLTATPVPSVNTAPAQTYAQIAQDSLAALNTPSQAETDRSSSISALLQNMVADENKAADTASFNESQGVNAANKSVQDLSSQIIANNNATAADKLAVGQNVGGITSADRQGFESEIDRTRAIKNLNLSAQLQAAQGNLAIAQDLVKQAVDAKYAPLETRIANLKTFLDINATDLSRADAKALNAQKTLLDAKQKDLQEKKQNDKDIQTMLLDAQAQQAPASVLNAAKTLAENGGSAIDVARVIGPYSGDVAKANLLKQQIITEKAQQNSAYASADNARASAAKTRAETAQLGTTGGKTLTADQVASAGYADRIAQANAVIDSKADTFKNMSYAQFKLVESNSPIANSLLTPDQRQAAQAMKNFITAKLRKESGASISPTEFADARSQYFPALGDDPGTLAQKKTLRDSVLNNLITGSGSAYQGTTVPQAPVINPFSTALGQTASSIAGSSIVGVSSNGGFKFNIP